MTKKEEETSTSMQTAATQFDMTSFSNSWLVISVRDSACLLDMAASTAAAATENYLPTDFAPP